MNDQLTCTLLYLDQLKLFEIGDPSEDEYHLPFDAREKGFRPIR